MLCAQRWEVESDGRFPLDFGDLCLHCRAQFVQPGAAGGAGGHRRPVDVDGPPGVALRQNDNLAGRVVRGQFVAFPIVQRPRRIKAQQADVARSGRRMCQTLRTGGDGIAGMLHPGRVDQRRTVVDSDRA